jgi:hypothetical protein
MPPSEAPGWIDGIVDVAFSGRWRSMHGQISSHDAGASATAPSSSRVKGSLPMSFTLSSRLTGAPSRHQGTAERRTRRRRSQWGPGAGSRERPLYCTLRSGLPAGPPTALSHGAQAYNSRSPVQIAIRAGYRPRGKGSGRKAAECCCGVRSISELDQNASDEQKVTEATHGND